MRYLLLLVVLVGCRVEKPYTYHPSWEVEYKTVQVVKGYDLHKETVNVSYIVSCRGLPEGLGYARAERHEDDPLPPRTRLEFLDGRKMFVLETPEQIANMDGLAEVTVLTERIVEEERILADPERRGAI